MSVTDEQTALAKARLKARNLARVVREQQSTIERLEAQVRELEASRNRGAHGAVPQGTRDAESAGTNVPRVDERVPFPSSPHDMQSQSRSSRAVDTAHAVMQTTRPKGRGGSQARGTRGTVNDGGTRPGGRGSGTRRGCAGGANAPTARDGSW